MGKSPNLLEQAAVLGDKARRALRLAGKLGSEADRARLTNFSVELRQQANELERQAAAETPRGPAEPSRDSTQDDQTTPKKGRGGSNDPEPQA